MANARIDSLAERIKERENQASPTPKHPNRYTAPAVQLKKRLDVLWAQLRYPTYKSPWYATPADTWWLIIQSYDIALTDIYRHLSYLISLDTYTHTVTHNRGYYCRKKQETQLYLISEYGANPTQIYTMRDKAREWFFSSNPRQPLHTFLFNYLISLQDEQTKESGDE